MCARGKMGVHAHCTCECGVDMCVRVYSRVCERVCVLMSSIRQENSAGRVPECWRTKKPIDLSSVLNSHCKASKITPKNVTVVQTASAVFLCYLFAIHNAACDTATLRHSALRDDSIMTEKAYRRAAL